MPGATVIVNYASNEIGGAALAVHESIKVKARGVKGTDYMSWTCVEIQGNEIYMASVYGPCGHEDKKIYLVKRHSEWKGLDFNPGLEYVFVTGGLFGTYTDFERGTTKRLGRSGDCLEPGGHLQHRSTEDRPTVYPTSGLTSEGNQKLAELPYVKEITELVDSLPKEKAPGEDRLTAGPPRIVGVDGRKLCSVYRGDLGKPQPAKIQHDSDD
ncbi:hypothetical protein R1sor_010743 [Riccia sorocarpa]|uniref:Uncharacterized protein n=1 Tax=Riccia sorocarpa TaxID=122646 RepID=A0ABD3I1N3_9MARC